MSTVPENNIVENQPPREQFRPTTTDTTREVPFDSLKLYAGLQEVVNNPTTNAAQNNGIRDLGFPALDFEDPEGNETDHEHSSDANNQFQFTSLIDNTDEHRTAVDGMLNSTDEVEQARGRRLEEMLNSTNQADNDSARALVNMLGSDDYYQMAQNMLDLFATSEINTMVQLLNDPNRANHARTIESMMANSESPLSGAMDAQRMLSLIGSTDGDTRAAGQRLLNMMGNENERGLASRLLNQDSASIQQFFQIQDDPNQAELASQLTNLLTSEDNREVRAGNSILSMMSSNDGAERFAGGTLADMLTDENQRDAAITIAGTLDNPSQRMQMLDLLGTPAGDRLVDMLRDEDRSRSAENLLNMLGSEFPTERRDGNNLLNMLGTDNASDAERVLGMSDPQSRHHLTEMLSNPATRQGGQQILSMLDSENRRERAAANELLQSMETPANADRNNSIIGQLSGDNAAAARTFLTAYHQDDPRNLDQAMRLLETNPEQGRRVATMLGGTPQERSAARTLIEMRVNEQNSPAPGDRSRDRLPRGEQQSDPREREPQGPRTSDQMLQMLANPNERHQALTILSNLNANQVDRFMGLRAQYPNAFQHMTNMMQNGQRDAVRNFLDLPGGAGAAPSRSPKDIAQMGVREGDSNTASQPMQRILEMLNNPRDAQSRQTAETLMRSLSSPEQFSNMTRLMSTPGYQAESNQLMQMMQDPRRSSEASNILSNLSQPEQIRTMLGLLNDQNQRRSTDQLMGMLSDGSGARLLDMMGSSDQTTRQTGRNLFNMLGTDNVYDAQNIISAQTTPAQAQILMDMLNNRETAPGARQLINRLGLEPTGDPPTPNPVRFGAQSLLAMMEQGGAAGDTARRLASMLGSTTDSRQADAILGMQNPAAMQAVMNALNDPNRRQAAEQIRNLLNSAEPGSQTIQNLGSIIASPESGRLLDMLNNPAQQGAANDILRRVSRPDQAQQMMQMLSQEATRPLGEQLLRMLQSNNNSQIRGAENWLSVMGRADESNRNGINHINEMLADPARRDQAVAMLSGLENDAQQSQLATLLGDRNNPGVQQLVSMLTSGDRRQVEGVRSFLALRQGEAFGRRLDDALPAAGRTSDQLLQMLSNPDTRGRARDILSASGGASDQLNTLFEMSNNPNYNESFNRILAAVRNPDQEAAMRAVLSRVTNPAELNQMVQIMNDANYRNAAQELTSILQNDERNPFAVNNLMRALTSNNEAERQAGRRLLDMLNSEDSDNQRNAGDILDSIPTPQNLITLMNITNNPQMREAASQIMELLREDPDSARALFGLLESQNAREQEQGRHLLSQLNSWSTAPYAVRSLERRATRVGGKKG